MTMRELTEARSEVRLIGPEEARELIDNHMFERQRSLDLKHVKKLEKAIEEKKFTQNTMIWFAYYNGTPHIIDGQHRLHAVANTGVAQTFSLLHQDFKSYDEIGETYRHLDHHKVRTIVQDAEAIGLREKLGLSVQEFKFLSNVLPHLKSGCTRRRTGYNFGMDEDERFEKMPVYGPYMRELLDLIDGARTKHRARMLRASTLAIALLTLRFSAPLSLARGGRSVHQFWTGMAFDNGLMADDPRKVALQHILDYEIDIGDTNKTGHQRTAAYSSRYVAQCFTAYMERRSIKFTRVYDEVSPLGIYGVPPEPEKWW